MILVMPAEPLVIVLHARADLASWLPGSRLDVAEVERSIQTLLSARLGN